MVFRHRLKHKKIPIVRGTAEGNRWDKASYLRRLKVSLSVRSALPPLREIDCVSLYPIHYYLILKGKLVWACVRVGRAKDACWCLCGSPGPTGSWRVVGDGPGKEVIEAAPFLSLQSCTPTGPESLSNSTLITSHYLLLLISLTLGTLFYTSPY